MSVIGNDSRHSRFGGRLVGAIVAAAIVGGVALGARQTFGLLVGPISAELDVSITLVALAIAIHNLVWGMAQPFAGAAADRYGPTPVVATGAALLAAGLAAPAVFPGAPALLLGLGVLFGLGVSCTGFGIVMTVVGKAAPPARRGMAMGIASAGGSVGQALFVPVVSLTLNHSGVTLALWLLAAAAMLVAPLGYVMRPDRQVAAPGRVGAATPGATHAISSALTDANFLLLTAGFFTCGFQLAFIATYLPSYLTLCQMPASLGATALAVIALFNIAGSWGCGWLGDRARPHCALGVLYLVRSIAMAIFVLGPKSPAGVVIFAAIMGLTWLGTVPLTSGVIAQLRGAANLGALFGVCFFSHQMGSFIGAWAGGAMFDLTGSFDGVWLAAILAGPLAAAMHFAIAMPERPALAA